MSNPTTQTYNALARAYTHFNRTLFNAQLPECLITFQRKKGAYGYFHGSQLHAMDDTKNHVDEIASTRPRSRDARAKTSCQRSLTRWRTSGNTTSASPREAATTTSNGPPR